jgi:molecular chaperone HscB
MSPGAACVGQASPYKVAARERQMTDPFATLGLPRSYAIDTGQLESHYRELQRALHPDRHAAQPASARRMNLLKAVEVNEAYRTLKDELKRAEALLALFGAGTAGVPGREDPEFLMEVMELREQLGDARAERDIEKVRALATRVGGLRDGARAQLERAFEKAAREGAPDVATLSSLIGRLKYYRRFMDEVDVIEEEAEA